MNKKSRCTCAQRLLNQDGGVALLQCLGYVTGANAAGTGLNGLNAAICYGSDLLQVWIPHGTGFIIGVAHIVTEARPFSTNITFSGHIFSSK